MCYIDKYKLYKYNMYINYLKMYKNNNRLCSCNYKKKFYKNENQFDVCKMNSYNQFY